MAGDPKSLTKAVTFGELSKISTKAIPKEGPMKGLDGSRFGSARNTTKNYTSKTQRKYGSR